MDTKNRIEMDIQTAIDSPSLTTDPPPTDPANSKGSSIRDRLIAIQAKLKDTKLTLDDPPPPTTTAGDSPTAPPATAGQALIKVTSSAQGGITIQDDQTTVTSSGDQLKIEQDGKNETIDFVATKEHQTTGGGGSIGSSEFIGSPGQTVTHSTLPQQTEEQKLMNDIDDFMVRYHQENPDIPTTDPSTRVLKTIISIIHGYPTKRFDLIATDLNIAKAIAAVSKNVNKTHQHYPRLNQLLSVYFFVKRKRRTCIGPNSDRARQNIDCRHDSHCSGNALQARCGYCKHHRTPGRGRSNEHGSPLPGLRCNPHLL